MKFKLLAIDLIFWTSYSSLVLHRGVHWTSAGLLEIREGENFGPHEIRIHGHKHRGYFVPRFLLVSGPCCMYIKGNSLFIFCQLEGYHS